MDQGLKERLVGAAVLIAIAVWLIPWVLDGPEAPIESGRSSLQLPAAEEPMPMRTQTLRLGDVPESAPATAAAPPPATEREPVAAAELPSFEDAESAPVAESEPDEAPVVAAVRPEPQPEPARAAVAPPAAAPAPAATPPKPAPAAGDWTVQLGSFGEEANARRVAQRAQTVGHKAEVSPIRSNGRTLYRVRVTPARSRAEADAAASALKAHGIADARVVSAR
jgi:DedD protein